MAGVLMTQASLGGLEVSLRFLITLQSVLTTTILAKERGWVDRAIGRAAFAVELAKGPAEAFTPLKAVLASISSVYAQYQVCFYAPFKPPL